MGVAWPPPWGPRPVVKTILSPELYKELRRLYAELADAKKQIVTAEVRVSSLSRRIKQILGTKDRSEAG